MNCFWKLKRKKRVIFVVTAVINIRYKSHILLQTIKIIRTNVVNVDLTAVSKSVIKRFGENFNFLSRADDCKSLNNN